MPPKRISSTYPIKNQFIMNNDSKVDLTYFIIFIAFSKQEQLLVENIVSKFELIELSTPFKVSQNYLFKLIQS